MSKKNNVNPDHYKTRGRLRQGEDIEQHLNRQKYSEEQARKREESRRGEKRLIPGGAGASTEGQAARMKRGAGPARKERAYAGGIGEIETPIDQVAKKSGKRSTAQKQASSRHGFDMTPASSPVAGAFGRRGSGSGKATKSRAGSSSPTNARSGRKR